MPFKEWPLQGSFMTPFLCFFFFIIFIPFPVRSDHEIPLYQHIFLRSQTNPSYAKNENTVKTLNIGTPRPATVVVFNIKPFNFTMK